MRRHAKASPAGSTQRQASGHGGFVRGAFATGASSGGIDGSGAPVSRRAGLAMAALVAVAALLLALSASASAAITHNVEPFSPIDGSASGLTLGEVVGVAIDETTGNVFVTDGFGTNRGTGTRQENERVSILGGEGGAPVGLAPPYEIPGLVFEENDFTPELAFDNSSSPAHGTLYVVGQQIPNVRKFTRNPATEKYEAAGEIAIPGGGRIGGLNVDGAGAVYVSAPANNSGNPGFVYKFDPTGSLLAEYEFAGGTPLANAGPTAVNGAGDLFVLAAGLLYELPADGAGEIDPTNYTKLGSASGFSLALDPANGHFYISTNRGDVGEYDSSGNLIDRFGAEAIASAQRLALDAGTGRIYVADGSQGTGGDSDVDVFGPGVVVPTTGIGGASDVTGTKATLNGSVNPAGIEVTACFFEWGETTAYGHTAPCSPPPASLGEDSEVHPVSAGITGLVPNGTTYHYRLVAENENGRERTADRTFSSASTVATEAATGVTTGKATLNGTLRPEGLQFTNCVFEYGLSTSAGFGQQIPCSPAASSIDPDFGFHPVSAALTGLQANATYKFRLTATNSKGTLSGTVLTFTTVGPPQVGEIRARDATQGAATLEAKINPNGFGTTYHFEWGSTSSYGHSVPADFEPFVGSGKIPVLVTAKLSGLSAGATYHYRIVAQSEAGATTTPDQVFETLNSCGLPEARCFELVNPRDSGPVAFAKWGGGIEPGYQAAPQSGSFSYTVETGLPDSTKGAEVQYRATRGPGGWSAAQLSPPLTARNETTEDSSASSSIKAMSPDLACDVVMSNQPLTDDASTRLVVEGGGANLYRHNPDGSYTAISKLAPENPTVFYAVPYSYFVYTVTDDCSHVIFSTRYRYAGVPAVPKTVGLPNPEYTYEWDEGTLRPFGYVPGPGGGEVPVIGEPGGGVLETGSGSAFSTDGSRLFFTAIRQTSPNPAEIGQKAIFVRENGTSRDVSLSQTSTADVGATYQFATKDGSRVFFTANAGLTDESSAAGTDLYEYDLESEELTDLSVDEDPGGAAVVGFAGASADGSHVYFVARGQLAPGKGGSFAENQSKAMYSVYGAEGGEVSYVGQVRESQWPSVASSNPAVRTARVSADGRYLLFESSAEVTRYDSGNNILEAYLYDDDATSEQVVCVSCRQDGEKSANFPVRRLVASQPGNSLYLPQSLITRNGEPQVYFSSFNALAPGAVRGRVNLYEWSHGQVFLIAVEPAGRTQGPPKEGTAELGELWAGLLGASADGTDLYLWTSQTLNWEDGDERASYYDARVGGGFPQPPPPPPPCNAVSEGSCQTGSPQTSAGLPATSATYGGPGNVKPAQPKKKQPKKKGKKKKQQQKQGKKSKRQANGNRRAGK